MKIVIELEDDDTETKTTMEVMDTEHPNWKWLIIDGRKYSVLTNDLEKLAMLI